MFSNNINSPEENEAIFLAKEAGQEIIERLQWMTLSPSKILSMNNDFCGLNEDLRKRYHGAEMFSGVSDSIKISSPNQSPQIDLLAANLVLPWVEDFMATLRSWQRFLRADGVLLMTAFGPDTLKELPEALQQFLKPGLIDMHDLGDMLIHAGFVEPVIEVSYLTVNYKESQKISRDLYFSRMIGLSPEEIEKIFLIENAENNWELTYEIILAHAFGKTPSQQMTANGVVKVPLSSLKRNS